MSERKTLLINDRPGRLFFPWIPKRLADVKHADEAFWFSRRDLPLRLYYKLRPDSARMHGICIRRALRRYRKIIFMDFSAPALLMHPAFAGQNKTHVFFWDPVERSLILRQGGDLEAVKRLHRVWSFQREDCEAYGLRFQTAVYVPPVGDFDRTKLYDTIFVGYEKGRGEQLRAVTSSLRAKIDIVPDDSDDEIPYIEYLRAVQQSRSVLDITQRGQTGHSLRVMEHLFFGVKLITDNTAIKEAEFYHPNNIFIVGVDAPGELGAWLDLPLVPRGRADYYSFECWVDRFQ